MASKSCGAGLAAAQFQLALDYASGDGIEADKYETAKWFEKAAEQGMVEVPIQTGLRYVYGAFTQT